MIEINDLTKAYGDNIVLDKVCLNIPSNTIYGLVGFSGAGKSTLLRCINGLEFYQKGSVTVDGIDVSRLKGKKLLEFRKNIGMIFQEFALLQRLNVYDNISLPMKCWHYPASEVKQRVHDLLNIVGMESKMHSYPAQLSGGEKQRVAIARALTLKPKVLLCDEVTSALDPQNTQSIIELLKQLNRDFGLTIIMVSHQIPVIMQSCNYTAFISSAKILLSGKTDELFMSENKELLRLIASQHDSLYKNSDIKISLINEQINQPLIARLAFETNVEFSIIGSAKEQYFDKNCLSYYLKVSPSQQERLTNWLRENQLRFLEL